MSESLARDHRKVVSAELRAEPVSHIAQALRCQFDDSAVLRCPDQIRQAGAMDPENQAGPSEQLDLLGKTQFAGCHNGKAALAHKIGQGAIVHRAAMFRVRSRYEDLQVGGRVGAVFRASSVA